MCVWVWVDVHALGDAMHGWKRQDAEGGRLDGAVEYGRGWDGRCWGVEWWSGRAAGGRRVRGAADGGARAQRG
jgi:hypothetical protein